MEKTRTKTKKVVKRRLKWKGVFFLALVCAGIYFGIKELIKVDISAIKITGNEYVKDAEIIKNAKLNESTSYFGFSKSSVCKDITSDPRIKTCKIKRGFDFKIEILIEENIPLFFYSPENATVLSDGSRVEGNNIYGLPTLVNHVQEEVMENFIARLSLVDNDIIRSISEIEYSPSTNDSGVYIDKERFIFDMNDGNTVIINNKKMSIMNHYKKIYASIDKKGVFNFDCDFDNYLFAEYGE